MRKGIFVLLLTVCFLYVSIVPTQAMDTKGLLKKVIAAQGGKKNLAGVKSSISEGKLILVAQGGMEGTMVIKTKAPNKTLSEIEIMGMKIIQAFDGETGWQDNPMTGGVSKMADIDSKAMARNAMGFEALLKPEKYGIKYNYAGEEKVEDVNCHVLETIYKDGFKSKSYFDSKTFLIKKSEATVETSQGTFKNESFFSDYKENNGIKSAYKLVIVRDGQEFMQLIMTSIKYNVDISDDDFKMKE